MTSSLDLATTYVALDEEARVTPLEVGDDFWETVEARPELAHGRLVGLFHYSSDWSAWEMHPAGDEVVYLLDGAVDLVLETDDGQEEVVQLRGRSAAVVPGGVWHTARVHEAGSALHLTPGAGTEQRPVEAARA